MRSARVRGGTQQQNGARPGASPRPVEERVESAGCPVRGNARDGAAITLAPMFHRASPGIALSLLSFATPVTAERQTLDTPAGRISYEVAGEGPALVLLHDGLLPAESWDGVWDFFTARWHTLRYDRRGYGLSEPARRQYD